jgi:hypothetical protein
MSMLHIFKNFEKIERLEQSAQLSHAILIRLTTPQLRVYLSLSLSSFEILVLIGTVALVDSYKH